MGTQKISDADALTFRRDGAVVLRRLLSTNWIDAISAGIEEIREHPSQLASSSTSGEYSLFFTDIYSMLRNPLLERFVRDSPAAAITAQLLGSKNCIYVLDQVFYKDSGLVAPSHWHQDTPYFNFSGHGMARFWVCCDPAPREVSLRIVRGSHLWNVIYRPGIPEGVQGEASTRLEVSEETPSFDKDLPSIPDINAYYDSFDILEWEIEPGDVIVFHPNVIHGAGGAINLINKRRAFGVLFAGDNAKYTIRPGYTVPDLGSIKGSPIFDGASLSDYPHIFPVVWTNPDREC